MVHYGFMSDEELLKRFKEWKKRAGRPKALASLTSRGISPRTAETLTNDFDDYKHSPKRKLRAALLDILKTEKAS